MPHGAIIGSIDVAQLVVIAFFLFFGGLVLHLRQEDKREGYPLKDPAGGHDSTGFPDMPDAKTFRLMDGGVVTAPHPEPASRPGHDLPGVRQFLAPGAPLVPVGDPLVDRLGPAAYPLRNDSPMLYRPGEPQVAPMRDLPGWSIAKGDADPRGMTVVGLDKAVAGVVRDLWIDRSVKILRYLEVELTAAAAGRHVLLPIYYTDVQRARGVVKVTALRAAQFAMTPQLREPDRISAREEDQVNAFYAGGLFFRAPLEPEHLPPGRMA